MKLNVLNQSLGIRCKKDSQASNTIAIGLSQFDGLFTNQSVYLRELLPGGGYAYYDIKAAPYQFTITADIATDENRFALVFVNPTPKMTISEQSITAILSPNPYTDGFRLSMNNAFEGFVNVQVFDLLGKLLEEGQYSSEELHNHNFGNGLCTGVYQVVITQGTCKQTIKVIKE